MPLTLDNLLSSSLDAIAALEAKDITPIQSQLRAFESDFDKAQSSLRTIASAWILAAIGAVGLVIQNELTGVKPLDGAVAGALRQALLFIAALGLASLWYLDQRVYQRLLHAVFSIGCHLELATEKVLPVRSCTYLLNRDVTHRLGWFYRAPLIVLLLAAGMNLVHAIFGLQATMAAALSLHIPAASPSATWLLPALFGVLHLLFSVWIFTSSSRWPTLDEQLPGDLMAVPRAD
jgi:hypothetical protein